MEPAMMHFAIAGDATLKDALAKFAIKGCTCVCVMDVQSHSTLSGIVSETDVLRAFLPGDKQPANGLQPFTSAAAAFPALATPISRLMKRADALTTITAAEASAYGPGVAKLMAAQGIKHVPVVKAAGTK
jgi:CBS domain-containing protein